MEKVNFDITNHTCRLSKFINSIWCNSSLHRFNSFIMTVEWNFTPHKCYCLYTCIFLHKNVFYICCNIAPYMFIFASLLQSDLNRFFPFTLSTCRYISIIIILHDSFFQKCFYFLLVYPLYIYMYLERCVAVIRVNKHLHAHLSVCT